jgi:toluene monooxygenase system ferredoxin subunit
MALEPTVPTDDLWEGEMRGVVARRRKILLLRLDGVVRAYEDRCAHLGVPLSEGTLAGGVLTCRAHCYEYDARTGAGLNPQTVCLTCIRAEERDGRIFVEVEP